MNFLQPENLKLAVCLVSQANHFDYQFSRRIDKAEPMPL